VLKASIVPLVLCSFLVVLGLDIGPAWSAKFGGGVHGTFTAYECERASAHHCFWVGTFASDDGRVQREDVGFDSGKVTHVSQRVRAVDTGDRVDVYPEDGGWDWLLITIFTVLLSAALALWIYIVPVQALKHEPQETTAEYRMRLWREKWAAEEKAAGGGTDEDHRV
jgi:hypothetical protein